MREIKFRGWSTPFENMEMPSGFGGAPGTDLIDYIEGMLARNDVIMQFTGLLDKNGKEIYEGDIIKVTNEWNETTTHKVEWGGEDYPAFDLEPTLSDELNSLCEIACGDYQYGVIGNIYENPDLIHTKEEK